MPREEQPLDPAGGPLVELANALRAARRASGKTYREMGKVAMYSHVALQRAANGKRRPTWQLTEAFLNACDASEEARQQVRRLWIFAHDATAYTPPSTATGSPSVLPAPRTVSTAMYPSYTDGAIVDFLTHSAPSSQDSSSETHLGALGVQVDRASILAGSLMKITTRVGFGDALQRFTELHGFGTSRSLASFVRASFPSVSFRAIDAWYAGRPTADRTVLAQVFNALGFDARSVEHREFLAALERIEDREIVWYQSLLGQRRTIVSAIQPGWTSADIADHTGLSERIVRNEIARLHQDCRTTSLTELALYLELIWARSRPSAQPRPTR